jgi:ATP-binding protein involved in chromosome partitioning
LKRPFHTMFWKKTPTQQDIFAHLGDLSAHMDSLVVENGHVMAAVRVDPDSPLNGEALRLSIEQKIKSLSGVRSVRTILTAHREAKAVDAKPDTAQKMAARPLAPAVRHIVAVASGKGGVGKSTVAANLAAACARAGLNVGLLDADIYGPSVPMLFGLRDAKPQMEDDYILPLEKNGLKIMSMGFMVDESKAMIWRGPMVQSAITQLLRDVRWDDLDILFLDMPPGTGDAQLTVAQKTPLAGAVIVSTPQDLALLDAEKAVAMFRKLSVPILGLVENMSIFSCPSCGHCEPIFGHGGAVQRAEKLGIPVLGELPLSSVIRARSDAGQLCNEPESQITTHFDVMARRVIESLDKTKISAA